MKCPNCGYLMADFDIDCPRCKSLSARAVQPQQPAPPTMPSASPSPALNPNAPLNAGQLVYALIVFGILAAAWLPFQCSRSVPGALGGNIITMSEYDQVREGMSYSEVAAIVGDPGQETTRSDVAGFSTIGYSWQNPDGSNMQCMFQNGKLQIKAQSGLH